MIYAIKFSERGKVISVSGFKNEADVPKGFIVYKGDIKPEKLLLKTKADLGLV